MSNTAMLVSNHAYYTTGYKYRLAESLAILTGLYPEKEIVSDANMIILTRDSLLFIRGGYSCDGPSGPTIDTKNFMVGAFVHDALYELLSQEKFKNVICRDSTGQELDFNDIRLKADQLLRQILLHKGMWPLRANWVYLGVRKGGLSSAMVRRKVFKA